MTTTTLRDRISELLEGEYDGYPVRAERAADAILALFRDEAPPSDEELRELLDRERSTDVPGYTLRAMRKLIQSTIAKTEAEARAESKQHLDDSVRALIARDDVREELASAREAHAQNRAEWVATTETAQANSERYLQEMTEAREELRLNRAEADQAARLLGGLSHPWAMSAVASLERIANRAPLPAAPEPARYRCADDQSDAEIGALVRAAYARHNAQPGCLVELESVEAVEVEVGGVVGPGVVLLRVQHRSKLKGGADG